MSMVIQEAIKFRPVSIIIDDVRTLNLIRFALDEFYQMNGTGDIENKINTINNYKDALDSMKELQDIVAVLEEICKV